MVDGKYGEKITRKRIQWHIVQNLPQVLAYVINKIKPKKLVYKCNLCNKIIYYTNINMNW